MTPSTIVKEFFATFVSFFKKKQAFVAILFMLLYRFPEAQLAKLVTPFLVDPREVGGLGLSTAEIGLVYGTIGTIGLTLGGILGGIAASAGGLKKWIWPMALAISLPDAVFIYLSSALPDNLWIVNICVFVEQFGYGFGFTAYMLYLIYYSDGEHKTAHYADLYGFYGFRSDVTRNGCRLVAGTDGLREFLLVGDGMLPDNTACHSLPEDRP